MLMLSHSEDCITVPITLPCMPLKIRELYNSKGLRSTEEVNIISSARHSCRC